MKKITFTFKPSKEILLEASKMHIVSFATHELTTEEIIPFLRQEKPDGIIITLQQSFSEEIINLLPSEIKIIATTSVGHNHINIACAKKNGIIATNAPDTVTACTADMTMLLMLNAARRGREALEIMKEGWGAERKESKILSMRLTGKTLGIFGMGRIGQAVAKRARAFDMKILYCNRNRLSRDLEGDATYYSNFHEMLPHSEVLSLNAPATPETNLIMGEREFSLLPANAIFINTSRGSLVDEMALIEALRSGHLYSAGLDVYHNEPHFNKELLNFPQIYLTPHFATSTIETRLEVGLRSLQNVVMFFNGEVPRDQL